MKTIRPSHWLHSAARYVLLGGALMLPTISRAIPSLIDYTLSGGTYTYNVTNGLSVPLTNFVVYFPSVADPSGNGMNYALGAATSPLGWTAVVTQPAPSFGGSAAWTGGSIPVGGTQGGFNVAFTYTGNVPPAHQDYQVLDSAGGVIASGNTSSPLNNGNGPYAAVVSVPDAVSTLACLGFGLIALLGFKRSYRRTA